MFLYLKSENMGFHLTEVAELLGQSGGCWCRRSRRYRMSYWCCLVPLCHEATGPPWFGQAAWDISCDLANHNIMTLVNPHPIYVPQWLFWGRNW